MGKRNRNLARDQRHARLARIGLGLLATLPYPLMVRLGGWLGSIALRIPELRKRIGANLAYVMPDLTPAERARITSDIGKTFGRTYIEILNSRRFAVARKWRAPDAQAARHIRAAAQSGKGAVLVSGHLGQWEALRIWMKSQGMVCAGVYRPFDNRSLNAFYLDNLERTGAPIFAKGKRGMRGLVKHMADGGIVLILTDQYDSHAESLDFLGKPAPTSLVAAQLALRNKCPLIPVYGIRDDDGIGVQAIVEEPIPHTNASEMMEQVNASLATRIHAHPGQYYWLHMRWSKTLRG